MVDLNTALDALARAPRVGGRSPFLVAAAVGYGCGVTAATAVATAHGRPPALVALMAGVGLLAMWAAATVRRVWSGRESLVQLEQVWAVLASCALVLHLMRQPVLAGLDVLAVGLAVMLAVGRVGCFLVGCCHGRPGSVGVAYSSATVAAHARTPVWLQDVRLLPVPLGEALGLLGISGVCAATTGIAAGCATAVLLVALGALRCVTEAFRGDRRPHHGGVSRAQWMASVQIGLGTWLGCPAVVAVSRPELAMAAAVLASATAFGLCSAARGGRRLLRPAHVRELRTVVDRGRTAVAAGAGRWTARTTGGVAVSLAMRPDGSPGLSLGGATVPHLCELAARAVGELDPSTAASHPSGHLYVALLPAGTPPLDDAVDRCRRLRATLSRVGSADPGPTVARR